MRLPPTGRIKGDANAEAEAITVCGDHRREARACREPYDAFVKACLCLFDHGMTTVPSPSSDRIVIHSIQNAVISATLLQIQNPPQINLQPVETGEPPTYYWSGPASAGLMLGLPPEQVADVPDPLTGEPIPPQPIDSMTGEALVGQACDAASFPVLPPGMIRPDWVTAVNDASSAQPLQTVLDVIWQRSEVDEEYAQFQFDINIRGWMDLLFDFDHINKKIILLPIPQTQVYMDPTVRDVDKAAYVGVDIILDAADASARYPDLADIIAEKSAMREMGGRAYRTAEADYGSTQDIDYKRPTVTLQVFWFRNQQVPMHPEEAIAAGIVSVQTQQVMGEPQLDPMTGGAVPTMSEEPVTDAAGESVLILASSGQPVTQADPAWPLRLGIRQITLVDDVFADDRECPHVDIPIIHGVNIQTSETSPYGFGEPLRMKPLQQADSLMFDAMVRNARLNGYPIEWIPESVASQLPNGGKNAYSKPGQRYIVDDELLKNLPNSSLLGMQMPPPLTPALAEVAMRVGEKFKEISGHTDVAQGIAPSAQASGKMVELLQSANTSMTDYKAWRRKKVLRRIAKLALHQIIWGMEVEDVERIISKYPRNVLDALHTRWRMLDWDVRIDVSSGNGLQVQKRQMAQADLELGVLSPETYCDEANRDYDQEQQRIAKHAQRQARLAALMGPAPGEEDEGGDKGKKPPGGE